MASTDLDTKSSLLPKKKALGRGLGALIPSSPIAASVAAQLQRDAASSSAARDYFVCALDLIVPSPTQPRKHFDPTALEDLTNSIRESGLIQPIVVRKLAGESRADDRYEIIAGERRWRASRAAGLTEVPVVVKDVSDAVAFALALIENIQRHDLNPIEEAIAYQRLLEEFGFTQQDLASQVGKSRAAIANAIRLLSLHPSIQELLIEGAMTPGHGRALAALPHDDALALAQRALDEGMTVRQVEAAVRAIKEPQLPFITPAADDQQSSEPQADLLATPPAAPAQPPVEEDSMTEGQHLDVPADPQLVQLSEKLAEQLHTRVQIRERGGKGRLELHFDSRDTLYAILSQLGLK
jgi:ParB family transcriptional regulator, chromosome partitioning protein